MNLDVGWLKILLIGHFVLLLTDRKLRRILSFTSDSCMVWKTLSVLTAGSFIHDVNIDQILKKKKKSIYICICIYEQRKEISLLFKGIKGQWISNGNMAKTHGCCSFHYIGLKNDVTY